MDRKARIPSPGAFCHFISQGIKRLGSKLKEVKGLAEKITGIEKSLTAKSSRKILIFLCLLRIFVKRHTYRGMIQGLDNEVETSSETWVAKISVVGKR
jgi:hypothetical protein